jgi:hypothetical protein
MYWSERIGVVAISNNKNNREIEAIPGLFRLNVGWSAHFFLGRPTFLLPVGLISVTNLGMRVSFVLNTVSWQVRGGAGWVYCRRSRRPWIRKLPNGNALIYRTGLDDDKTVAAG